MNLQELQQAYKKALQEQKKADKMIDKIELSDGTKSAYVKVLNTANDKLNDALEALLNYTPPPVIEGNKPEQSGWYFVHYYNEILIDYFNNNWDKWNRLNDSKGFIIKFQAIEMPEKL
jgi:hypothetical protein